MNRAKEIWEEYAVSDAYFAVSTFDKFRAGKIDEAAKAEFFESGRRHVYEIWNEIEMRFGFKMRPKRALDYGCGVGRILLPLAERCESAVGVDISQAMLAETGRNLDAKGLDNVDLQEVDEFNAAESDTYDLVHSYIVLQHIEPVIGYGIIEKMLARLESGGFGMIHVTHTDPSGTFRRLRSRVYRDVPAVHRLLNRARGRTAAIMPMYEYDRERIYSLLDANICHERFAKQTDHGLLGEMIFFRKQ